MTDRTPSPDLVAAVRAHALDHYETDGWDFLIECWEDADVAQAIGSAGTLEEAIEAVRPTLRILDERRAEVRAEIF